MKECENIRKRKVVSLQIKEIHIQVEKSMPQCCFYLLVFLLLYLKVLIIHLIQNSLFPFSKFQFSNSILLSRKGRLNTVSLQILSAGFSYVL